MSQIQQTVKFTELAKFQPKQLEAWAKLFDPNTKYLLYGGAANGGKSYFLRWAAIGLGMYYYAKYKIKHIPIGLFSTDYPTLKDRQVIRLKNEIPDYIGEVKDSRDEGYSFIARPEYGEFVVLLRNLDDPSKYKSAEFAAVLVEELTENTEETFDDLRFRMRYGSFPDVKFIGATNPGGIGHGFVKRKWVKPDLALPDVEQERFVFIPAKYSDNKYTTEGYVHQLDALPEEKRRAYKEGDWDIFAGQFFSEWRDVLHTCKALEPSTKLFKIGGLDWGRTKPFAFLGAFLQVVDYEGVKFHRIVVYKEVYGTDKRPDEWGSEIALKVNLKEYDSIQADNQIFVPNLDKSISIRDQFVDYNEDFMILKPASKDRIGGWENIHNWLKLAPDDLPYLLVTESCPNLIRTLPELVHDDHRVEDVDTEGEDHAPDALSYMLKAVKWIDADVGATLQKSKLKVRLPKYRDYIDLDKFETAAVKKKDWRSI